MLLFCVRDRACFVWVLFVGGRHEEREKRQKELVLSSDELANYLQIQIRGLFVIPFYLALIAFIIQRLYWGFYYLKCECGLR